MVDIAIFLMDLEGGGAERVMLNLAQGFVDQGLTIDLVLVKFKGSYQNQLPKKVRVVELGAPRLIASFPKLIQYLRKEKPSVLMSALEDTNFVAIWAKKFSGVNTRIVVTVHNHLSLFSKNATQLKRRLAPQLARMFYPWSENVVAVSQGVADDLVAMGLPPRKVTVIYNPIVAPDLYQKSQQAVDHPWLLPGQPPVILGVGRLTKQKDFSTLIRAFAQVRQKRPVRLLILGEGEEQVNLVTLARELGIEKDVSFPGFIENPYAYMSKVAVLALSSAWEGFGNVLVEAMAVGTPVVSTDCQSGPAEILENGRYGQLAPVGESEALAKSISIALEQASESFTSAFQVRANEFTIEIAAKRYLKLILPL